MKIVPMQKDFILYRCLHAGLLSPSNIESKSTNVPGLPRELIERNNFFIGRDIEEIALYHKVECALTHSASG